MTSKQSRPLDIGFSRISALVAGMGDGCEPRRSPLAQLMADTRDALDAGNKQAFRQRMSA